MPTYEGDRERRMAARHRVRTRERSARRACRAEEENDMPQGKKTVILNVLDILKQYSDADHRLSVADIVAILKRDYDTEVDRKTVKRDLDELRDLGYRINATDTVRKKRDGSEELLQSDWYLASDFSEPELRLMIDSLMSSKHVSQRQLSGLIKKIEGLGNKYFSKRIRPARALRQSLPENAEIFLNLELLGEAINARRQVTFAYHDYGTDKKMHPRTDSEGRIKRHVVNPYQMIMANGRYYLIGNYDKYDGIAHCRIDRIKDIQILDTPAKRPERVKGLENGLDLPTHMAEHIYMFGGTCGMVTFRSKKKILNDIIDWFGTDVRFFDECEEEVTAAVRVNYTAMKYWAMQYGAYVTVTSPPPLVEAIRRELADMTAKYGG